MTQIFTDVHRLLDVWAFGLLGEVGGHKIRAQGAGGKRCKVKGQRLKAPQYDLPHLRGRQG
jgi:hypothetical protein